MAQVKNLLSHVNKLRSHRIIQQPPKWYQPMAIVPPPLPPPHCVYDYNLEGSQNFEKELTNEQESHYRTQIQALLNSEKPTLPKNKKHKSKQKKEGFLPKPIVFPEDVLRKKFYKQYPFELLRPQELAESGPIGIDYSTPLTQRKSVTGEDVIQHQLYLISQGMTVDESFRKVTTEFEIVRLEEEAQKEKAKDEALKQAKLNQSPTLSDAEKFINELKIKFPKNYEAWKEEDRELVSLNKPFSKP